MRRLLKGDETPAVPGLRMRQDFYLVLGDPVPLAGMAFPKAGFPWQALAGLGFKHVVCLTSEEPPYQPTPLKLLHAAALEDLYHGNPPQDPEMEVEKLRQTADAVLTALNAGEGVVVHCAGGTGRTGTVLGWVLRRLGYDRDEVLAYLDELHLSRGKPGWPESPWQAEILP